MLSVTGTGTEPAKVGISIADIAAGMYAYTNILAAIMQRGKTGKGSKIDISMLESMAEWMSFPLYYTHDNAPGPKPTGAAHATIYPYGPFECGEGGSVMLGVQNEREFASFCNKVLGNAALATDDRFSTNSSRTTNRAELKAEIDQVFAKLSVAQVIERLDEASIANASVNDMQGVWNHPQLQARNRWTEVDTPAGRVPALLPPGTGDGVQARMGAVPSVGQHNEAILAELGIER